MTIQPIGTMIRDWRARRRLSQLDLASEADVSQRHLSFIESGRARPSRDMVLHLAEQLDVPLRDRNRLLLAAGFAPSFEERSIGHPSLEPAMTAVGKVLEGHAPNPALAIDRHWNLVAANKAAATFLSEGIAERLLIPPVNVLRLSLHPEGLAPRIVNLAGWRAHLLERLHRLIVATGDDALVTLEEELKTYPAGVSRTRPLHDEAQMIAYPLQIRAGEVVLSFFTTTTVFGTPLDVTLSELAIESFFAADAGTRFTLQALADGHA
ncbi:MAG: helix-turn-helix domain-containing protein [Rhizobiaceae bacterium]